MYSQIKKQTGNCLNVTLKMHLFYMTTHLKNPSLSVGVFKQV